jgi:hypothetical protein
LRTRLATWTTSSPSDVGAAEESLAELRSKAEDFAARITDTVRIVAGEETPAFRLRGAVGERGAVHAVIRQDPAQGIKLTVDGLPLLLLRVDFRCTWDHAQKFLAVDTSAIKVYASQDGEPLLRYEYSRDSEADLPGAHLHVHAHRDALTYVMSMAGQASPRGKRRVARLGSGVGPRMSELHFPLGGPRFRPCLEDILQVLIAELGVDAPAGATEALQAGRVDWRKDQLAAAVRDSPETAAKVLREELDYIVTAPPDSGAAPDRLDKLQAL